MKHVGRVEHRVEHLIREGIERQTSPTKFMTCCTGWFNRHLTKMVSNLNHQIWQRCGA